MDKEVSLLVHVLGHNDAGVSMDQLTRAVTDTFGVVDVDTIQAAVDRLVDFGAVQLLPSSRAVTPSPTFLSLYFPGGVVRIDKAADLSHLLYAETYVPDFAAGFLIGKHGEYCSQIFSTTGVRVLFSPFRSTLQKAVFNLARVHPSCRRTAVQHTLVMLRRRIFALYYSYKSRASDKTIELMRVVQQPCVSSAASQRSSWSVWSHTPFSTLLSELLVRT